MKTTPQRALNSTFLCSIFLAGSLLAQEAERPFIFEPDVKAPMRDGVQLAANVWRPKAEGRYPVILMRSPYGNGRSFHLSEPGGRPP